MEEEAGDEQGSAGGQWARIQGCSAPKRGGRGGRVQELPKRFVENLIPDGEIRVGNGGEGCVSGCGCGYGYEYGQGDVR